MNFISTFEELNKLYEEAPQVVNKHVDDVYAVMFDDQQKFTGTKEECENWLKSKTGPLAARFKIVSGADVLVKESCAKEELTEAAEDEEIEIVDDEVVDEAPMDDIPVEEPVEELDDEPKQLILECDKCGALVIKDEADIVTDEESDLVNIEEECKFCEETKGYKIIGTLLPYEVSENIDSEIGTEEPITGEA